MAEVGSKLSLFSNRGYYLDKNNGQIVFDPTKLYTGNVLTIKSSGYHDLYLKVTRQGENFKVEKTASGKTNISGASNGVNTLHIRLSGYFEKRCYRTEKNMMRLPVLLIQLLPIKTVM